MHALAVQLRTRCDRCGQGLPVNRLAVRVRCLACLQENAFPAELWAALLEDVLWEPLRAPRRAEIDAGGRWFDLEVAPAELPGRRRPRGSELAAALPAVVGTDNEDPEDPALPLAARLPRSSRLHPANRVRRWVLVVEPRQGAAEPHPWAGDAVEMPDGSVVVVVRHERGFGVACFYGDDLRWVRRDFIAAADALVIAPSPGGPWIACHAWPHALRLSPRDGATLEERGEREPEGASVHHLDLRGVVDLLPCPDGTWLVHMHQRLWRYGADGQGIRTWPSSWLGRLLGERAELPPLYRAGRPTVDRDAPAREGQAEHQPLVVFDGRWAVGADGTLIQVAADAQTPFVASYGPDGTRRWVRPIPGEVGPSPPQLGPDGSVWVVSRGPGRVEVVVWSAGGEPAAQPAWGRWPVGRWAGTPRLLRIGDHAAVYDGVSRQWYAGE